MSYKAFCSNYGEHSTNAVGYHCWNGEAMRSMKSDMSAAWDNFLLGLDAHLELISGEVDEAFDTVLEVALSTNANEPGVTNNTRSAMRTLANALHHRQDLALHGIERANEIFQSELRSLQTDAFSSIRTAFITQQIWTTVNLLSHSQLDHA
jgi:hypothetical protein